MKHLDKVGQDLVRRASGRPPSAARRGSRPRSTQNRHKLVETLEEMRLNKKTIDRIVVKLRALIQKVERADSGSTELERRTGVDKEQLRKEARTVKGDAAASAGSSAATGSRAKRSSRATPPRRRTCGKVEEELQLDVKVLREHLQRHPRRRAGRRAGEGGARRGEPAPRRLDREEVHEPRPPVPRPHPGGEHRPHEGGRQVRVQARLQVLDVRHVVDSGRPSRAPSPTRRGPSASRST